MLVGISVLAITIQRFRWINSRNVSRTVKVLRAGALVIGSEGVTKFTLRPVLRVAHIDSAIFMADVANKYEINILGKYYVDNQCIDCDLCRETAPDNFKRNDDGGYSFVYKQPESEEEETRCKEAKEGCPVEAIGDNGG